MDPKYDYDVFISYSSLDKAWAEKLSGELEKKYIEPFIDQSELKAGAEWEKKILYSLGISKHMVVLWSGNAEKSAWMRREIGYFEASIYNPVLNEAISQRRLIFLCLEQTPVAYASLQMITNIRDAAAYSAGAEMVNPDLWQLVLSKVYDAITSDTSTIPVPLIILTTTRDRLLLLNSAHQPPVGDPMDTLLDKIGIGTKEALLPYYGDQRTDWRPFGSEYNVSSILDRLKDEVNNILSDVSIRWELAGDDFWSKDPEKFFREVNKLSTVFSVVMIDPLALYDDDVLYRFNQLTNSLLQNEKSLIMTLSPFAMPKPNSEFRKLIKQMANSVYIHLYAPIQGLTSRYAHCDIHIGDEMDIKRALLDTMGKYIKKTEKTTEYLLNRANS